MTVKFYTVHVTILSGRREWRALPALIRWTAPEILDNPTADEEQDHDVFSPACDVYSFGMVLWEIATITDPFHDIPDDSEVNSLLSVHAFICECVPVYRHARFC